MVKKYVDITVEGKKELEKELKSLISRRPEIAEKIATARAFGDLSENEEYSAARGEQKKVETRILDIEAILKNAKVISGGGRKDKVKIGVRVKVLFKKKEIEYLIVGKVEADPLEGKISDESPIGKALLGKKVGEKATLVTPKGKSEYTIVEIA